MESLRNTDFIQNDNPSPLYKILYRRTKTTFNKRTSIRYKQEKGKRGMNHLREGWRIHTDRQ